MPPAAPAALAAPVVPLRPLTSPSLAVAPPVVAHTASCRCGGGAPRWWSAMAKPPIVKRVHERRSLTHPSSAAAAASAGAACALYRYQSTHDPASAPVTTTNAASAPANAACAPATISNAASATAHRSPKFAEADDVVAFWICHGSIRPRLSLAQCTTWTLQYGNCRIPVS